MPTDAIRECQCFGELPAFEVEQFRWIALPPEFTLTIKSGNPHRSLAHRLFTGETDSVMMRRDGFIPSHLLTLVTLHFDLLHARQCFLSFRERHGQNAVFEFGVDFVSVHT